MTSKSTDPVRVLDETLTQLQEQRTQQLIEAREYQTVERWTLDRERIRMATKYGKDHPRVQAIEARLEAHQRLAKTIDVEVDRSRTRQTPLPEGGWRVQGGVFDADSKEPRRDLSVYLSNARHEPLNDLGYACTDEQGHYAISLEREQVASQKEVYLTVADANKTVLCRTKTPLNPIPDSVQSSDLYIGKSGCKDPFETPNKKNTN